LPVKADETACSNQINKHCWSIRKANGDKAG